MSRALIVGVVVVALVATGCGATTAEPTTTQKTMTQTTTTAQAKTTTTAKVTTTAAAVTTTEAASPFKLKWGDAVTVDRLEIAVSAPQEDTNLSDTEKLFLEKGSRIVYCTATITNKSATAYSYNPLYFTMYDAEGQTFAASGIGSQPALNSGSLVPGRTIKGAVVFEIPIASEPAYVDFQLEIFGDVSASWGY
jgi:hypothetical protein